MRTRPAIAAAFLTTLFLAACGGPQVKDRDDAAAVIWHVGPPLPAPVTNNAVAAVETDAGVVVVSALGMDSTKTPAGVTNAVYRWDRGAGVQEWRVAAPVPGPGRLGATAQALGGKVYILGGYTVQPDGKERTVGSVNVYDAAADAWSAGAPIPVPTDDAVSGVWRDSLIVLLSGWHDDHSVTDVQWYDPATDRWTRGGPIPGTPVFGAAGAVVGDQIVYVDGVRTTDAEPRYALYKNDWVGSLSGSDPGAVAWKSPEPHPEPGLYRAASGSLGNLALFVGGTDNPYNYDGVGYDGTPAEPVRQVLAYAPGADEWRYLAAPPIASMDHRNLGIAGGTVFLVGGMEAGQKVSRKVWYVDAEQLLASIW